MLQNTRRTTLPQPDRGSQGENDHLKRGGGVVVSKTIFNTDAINKKRKKIFIDTGTGEE